MTREVDMHNERQQHRDAQKQRHRDRYTVMHRNEKCVGLVILVNVPLVGWLVLGGVCVVWLVWVAQWGGEVERSDWGYGESIVCKGRAEGERLTMNGRGYGTGLGQ